MAKTPPDDFQVTIPETPLLSQQAVTSKGIPSTLPTYSWTLTPIPNWTCFVVTVPLWCTAPKNVTNQFCGSQYSTSNPTKKVIGCKVLQFIHTMKIKKMLAHKTLQYKYTATSSRERDELGQELHLRSQFSWTVFAQCLCDMWTLWRPLKQSFYIFRVRRKESPNT